MKNFVQPGDTITLPAPYAVNGGDGLLVGGIFGIAAHTAANGADVETVREGVFNVTTLSTDTAAIGAKLYWDNGNKRLTTTVGSNLLVGVAVAAKAAGATTARVLLDGVIR